MAKDGCWSCGSSRERCRADMHLVELADAGARATDFRRVSRATRDDAGGSRVLGVVRRERRASARVDCLRDHHGGIGFGDAMLLGRARRFSLVATTLGRATPPRFGLCLRQLPRACAVRCHAVFSAATSAYTELAGLMRAMPHLSPWVIATAGPARGCCRGSTATRDRLRRSSMSQIESTETTSRPARAAGTCEGAPASKSIDA